MYETLMKVFCFLQNGLTTASRWLVDLTLLKETFEVYTTSHFDLILVRQIINTISKTTITYVLVNMSVYWSSSYILYFIFQCNALLLSICKVVIGSRYYLSHSQSILCFAISRQESINGSHGILKSSVIIIQDYFNRKQT